jgi:hypothetical protein
MTKTTGAETVIRTSATPAPVDGLDLEVRTGDLDGFPGRDGAGTPRLSGSCPGCYGLPRPGLPAWALPRRWGMTWGIDGLGWLIAGG